MVSVDVVLLLKCVHVCFDLDLIFTIHVHLYMWHSLIPHFQSTHVRIYARVINNVVFYILCPLSCRSVCTGYIPYTGPPPPYLHRNRCRRPLRPHVLSDLSAIHHYHCGGVCWSPSRLSQARYTGAHQLLCTRALRGS